MVAKQRRSFFLLIIDLFNFTFDERRLDKLSIEVRKRLPTVNGRRVTEVILLSPSDHIVEMIGFPLWYNKRLKSSNKVSRFLSRNPSTE